MTRLSLGQAIRSALQQRYATAAVAAVPALLSAAQMAHAQTAADNAAEGDLVAVMKGGQEVPVSRRFRTQVMDRLAS